MGVVDRLRRAVRHLGCSPAECAALAVLTAGAVAALALLWVAARPGPAGPASGGLAGVAGVTGSETPLSVTAAEIVVHVAGRVAAPGVYRLPGGARVADALEAAGGPLGDARLESLNLARALVDGEQIVVPGPGVPGAPAGVPGAASDAPASSPSGTGPDGSAPGGARRADGTLDLNRATAADLEELPGIGPILAERIVAHRDQHGPFTAVGDLRDVPGIGEKKLAEIAPHVAV